MSLSHTLIAHLPHSPLARLPWRAPLRKVPHRLQHILLGKALNAALSSQLEDGELDFLDGQVVAIRISDLDYHWAITVHDGKLCLLAECCNSDAQISHSLSQGLLSIQGLAVLLAKLSDLLIAPLGKLFQAAELTAGIVLST